MRVIFHLILALFLAFFFTLLLSVPINIALFVLNDHTVREIEMFAPAMMLPLWLGGLVVGFLFFRYKSKEANAWAHRLELPDSVMPRLCQALLASTAILFLLPLAFYLLQSLISQFPVLLVAIWLLVYSMATYGAIAAYRPRKKSA